MFYYNLLTDLSLLQKFAAALDGKMPAPQTFGVFHFICLALVLTACVVVCLTCRKISDKQYDVFLAITATVLILLELYKQFNFSYEWETDTWSYSWYAFPFQFCSTPLYVLPLALIFRKKQKIRDALRAFLATYALFAGLAVMIYPGNVYVETIGINLQTMIHHGSMPIVGVLTFASGKAKAAHTTVLKALPVFLIAASVALTLNLVFYHFVDPTQGFNMFFISPYETCSLPVLDQIQTLVPYPVFLLVYLVGFTAAGYLISLPVILIKNKQKEEIL